MHRNSTITLSSLKKSQLHPVKNCIILEGGFLKPLDKIKTEIVYKWRVWCGRLLVSDCGRMVITFYIIRCRCSSYSTSKNLKSIFLQFIPLCRYPCPGRSLTLIMPSGKEYTDVTLPVPTPLLAWAVALSSTHFRNLSLLQFSLILLKYHF